MSVKVFFISRHIPFQAKGPLIKATLRASAAPLYSPPIKKLYSQPLHAVWRKCCLALSELFYSVIRICLIVCFSSSID
jgi:hypothetical protein